MYLCASWRIHMFVLVLRARVFVSHTVACFPEIRPQSLGPSAALRHSQTAIRGISYSPQGNAFAVTASSTTPFMLITKVQRTCGGWFLFDLSSFQIPLLSKFLCSYTKDYNHTFAIKIPRLRSDRNKDWYSKSLRVNFINGIQPISVWCPFNLPRARSLFIPPTEGETREVKMISHSVLCINSELMRGGLTRALWEDQKSISGIGGQSQPSGPTHWQFVADHRTAGAQVRSRGGLNEMLIRATQVSAL